MWTEVKIHLPDAERERVFPADRGGTHASDARHLTAKLNDASRALPNEFFHYDELQRPKKGRPPVRFGSFTGGISVIGVGEVGVDLVESLGHKVRRLWSDHLGVALLETRYSGSNMLRYASYPKLYRIHGLAFERTKWGFTKDNWFESCSELLGTFIVKGLREQVIWNHEDDFKVCDGELLESLKTMQAEVLSAERLVLKRLNPGGDSKAAVPVARNVEFRLPIEIEGVWHVGRLPARGFGQIREVRGGITMERAHAVRE